MSDPDRGPEFHDTSDPVWGPRAAKVQGRTVWRYREDGSLDWATEHWTKRGARRAAEMYERTGRVKGFRP